MLWKKKTCLRLAAVFYLIPFTQCSKHELSTPSTSSPVFTIGGTVTGLSGSLTLQNTGETITLTESGTFTFATQAISGTVYSATLTSEPSAQHCSISNSSGTVESSNITNISVACVSKAWIHPASLNDYFNPGGTNAFAITLRGFVDTSYRAWIAFSQPPLGGGLHQIFYSNFNGSSWSHPANANAFINAPNKRSGNAQVVGNNNNQLLLSWAGWDGTALCGAGVPCYQTFASTYNNGTWTGLPNTNPDDNISPNGSDVISSIDSAMDSSGNAIIVWSQDDNNGDYQVFKSEYRNGAWTHPASLADNISPDGFDATAPKVAMDNNGNAVIVWYQNSHIFKSEYRSGIWSHPSNATNYIDPAGGAGSSLPRLAMDNNGNAIIVWKQEDGSNQQVFKSEYRNGAWTHPASLADNISPDGKYCFEPHVSMSDIGDAVIVWKQYDSSDTFQIFKSEYRSGAWVHPTGLSDNISPDSAAAGDSTTAYDQIASAMDRLGNTVLVWRQSDGSNQQIFKSEYRSGTWTHPSSLSDNISPNGKDCYTMDVSLSNPGMSLILWTQRDSNNDVQAYKSEYY